MSEQKYSVLKLRLSLNLKKQMLKTELFLIDMEK